ncbi:MAG: hypothetical protein ACR2RL_16510, partial [Gammaproteobacteria bacterium]
MRAFGLFVVLVALMGVAAWRLDITPQDLYARADISSLDETVETVQALTSDLGTTVKDWIASLPPTSAGSGSPQDQSANASHLSGAHGGVMIVARDLPSYSPEGDVATATTTQVAALDRARNAALEVEAREHVARLATPVAAPIAAAEADQFVAPDQIIELVPRPRTRRR